VFWIGNAEAGTISGSVLSPLGLSGSGGTESPYSFRLNLFVGNAATDSPLQDLLQFDARIERIVGQASVTVVPDENATAASYGRLTAGICMQEHSNTAVSGLQPVTGGADNVGEFYDMHSLTSGANFYVLQRRWLWLRRWVLANPGKGLNFTPDSTDGYLTPGSQFKFDIKPKVRMQFDNRGRSLWLPTLFIWWNGIVGGGGGEQPSVVLNDLFYRTLYSRGSAISRR